MTETADTPIGASAHVTQTCVKQGDIGKPLFDPETQPGTCTEKRGGTDDISTDCKGAVPVHTHRHLVGGLVDKADISGGYPGGSLNRSFRWLGADCAPKTPL